MNRNDKRNTDTVEPSFEIVGSAPTDPKISM